MEVYDPNQRNNISSEIIGVMKRMFGESWGPRLEYILRHTLLALLEYPDTTMLDINRMLTDKDFRSRVLSQVKDTVVLQFWRVEFAGWNERYVSEAIAPVLNKVGAFVANPVIRNIIGQPKSSFNIRQIMDEGKILIVNLSKGLIGEDNAAILGSFLVTKIQLAAMSRSDIPRIEDRRPFYLYVDEFQNFATDSFAVILSEARKYGLNLTVANQYISQMEDTVRDAVFGNVGTMVSMRVSPEDAPILAQQFAPNFEAQDILQMNNRHLVCGMMINGEKMPAFSGTTLKLPEAGKGYIDQIIEHSRANYTRPKAEVEAEIAELVTPPMGLMSRTARDKAKKALKEQQQAAAQSTANQLKNISSLMAQIRQTAQAGDPNSMKIEPTHETSSKSSGNGNGGSGSNKAHSGSSQAGQGSRGGQNQGSKNQPKKNKNKTNKHNRGADKGGQPSQPTPAAPVSQPNSPTSYVRPNRPLPQPHPSQPAKPDKPASVAPPTAQVHEIRFH